MSTLNEQVKDIADDAVKHFQDRVSGSLDYSIESLSLFESMLDDASDFYNDMSADQVAGIAEFVGSYILYVAYKECGGQFYWSDKMNQPVLVVGEPDFKVAIATFDKVVGRLAGDQADNIVFFFNGFKDRVQHAEHGLDVLYI